MAVARLETNATRLHELLEEAEAAVAAGRPAAELAARAERAAYFGVRHHPAVFSSTALERLVEHAASRMGALGSRARSGPRPASGDVRRVLHVLTKGYRIGGHTRLAWNWMDRDQGRQHDVVVLDQTGNLLPYELVRSARRTGGRIVDLTGLRAGYVEQVEALRSVGRDSDLVVLHHHPHDVVPGLAFASGEQRPPLVLVNHSGRVFATGFAAGDVVAWLRPGTGALLGGRRGVPDRRCARLPIPLSPPSSPRLAAAHRTGIRRRLGIPLDAVCVVTMASAHKYRPIDVLVLPDLLGEVARRNPQVHVIAVGPTPDADWGPAIDAAGGRIHAVGGHADPAPFLDAADLAVDSYPISSETAVRDAALAGLPVVSLARWRRDAPACAIDLPGDADTLLLRGQTAEEFLELVEGLIADPERRRAHGARIRDAVASDGLNPGFLDGVEALYRQATAAAPMTAAELDEERCELGVTDAITLLTGSGPTEVPTVERLMAGRAGGSGSPRYPTTNPLALRARTGLAQVHGRVRTAVRRTTSTGSASAEVVWPVIDGHRRPDPAEWHHLAETGLVSRKARVLYVPTPKAGCTTVKWALAEVEGTPEARTRRSDGVARSREGTIHSPDVHGLPLLGSLGPEELEQVLTDPGWIRLGVTRDPFDRLTSGWLNRVLTASPDAIGRGHWGPDLDGRRPDGSIDLVASFERFVDELVRPDGRFRDDVHFTPQVSCLALGVVPYTDLVDIAGIPAVVTTISERVGRSAPPSSVRNQGLRIDRRGLYGRETAEAATRVYADDLEAFGYPAIEVTGPASARGLDRQGTAFVDQLRAEHERLLDLSRVAQGRHGTRYAAAELRRAVARRMMGPGA